MTREKLKEFICTVGCEKCQFLVASRDSKSGQMYARPCGVIIFKTLKPGTHWRQSWIQHGRHCWKSTKSTVSLWPRTDWRQSRPYRQQSWMYTATKSTATSCRIHVVADLLPKPATKLNVSATKLNVYGNSRLCCRFVAGFGNSRLSTKSTVSNSTLSPVCTGLKAAKPLGRCRWNLGMYILWSEDTTSRQRNFEFPPLRRAGETTLPRPGCWFNDTFGNWKHVNQFQ